MFAEDSKATQPRDRLILAVALVLPTLITLVYFVWLAGSAPLVYGPLKVLQFALPAAWVYLLRRERRALFAAVGADARRRSLAVGAAFGTIVIVAGLAVYFFWLAPLGVFAESQPAIRGKVVEMQLATPARYIALSVFYALAHSFLEEYYWRWFVYRECRANMTAPAAICVSSLGFMAHHVLVLAQFFGWWSPLTWIFSAGVAIGGIVWAWLYERYGTLLGPWLSHLLLDAGIFAIGYHLVFA
jgi:membrane protease YdiL (CAAX protease family)